MGIIVIIAKNNKTIQNCSSSANIINGVNIKLTLSNGVNGLDDVSRKINLVSVQSKLLFFSDVQ